MLNILPSANLLRNQKIEYRNHYRQEKVNKLIKEGKNSESTVLIIMEYVKDMKWHHTCLMADKNWKAHRLVNYAQRFAITAGESVSLASPKNGIIIQPNRQIGELYDLYHDRDDKMLYLKVLVANIFGSNQWRNRSKIATVHLILITISHINSSIFIKTKRLGIQEYVENHSGVLLSL